MSDGSDNDSGGSNGHQWAPMEEITRLDERIDAEGRVAKYDINELLHRENKLERLVDRYDTTVVLVSDKLRALEHKMNTRLLEVGQKVTDLRQASLRTNAMLELLLKDRKLPVPQ